MLKQCRSLFISLLGVDQYLGRGHGQMVLSIFIFLFTTMHTMSAQISFPIDMSLSDFVLTHMPLNLFFQNVTRPPLRMCLGLSILVNNMLADVTLACVVLLVHYPLVLFVISLSEYIL